jgi:hypothetical protein
MTSVIVVIVLIALIAAVGVFALRSRRKGGVIAAPPMTPRTNDDEENP